MDARIQDELNLIKDSVLQTVPAEAIYLFGPYAYGTPNSDSDLYIYVVVPDNVADLSELYGDIQICLHQKKAIPIDLLVGRASVFNRRKAGPTLEKTIASKGLLLYGT